MGCRRLTICRGSNHILAAAARYLTCVFVTWAALPIPALADTFPGAYVSFGGQIFPFGGPTVNTGPLLQSSYTYSDTATSSDSSTGTIDASVQIGVMHLLAQGIVSPSAPCLSTFLGCTDPQVAADVQFGDTITPESGDLPEGTLVPFQFTSNLNYSATTGPQGGTFGGGGVFVGDFPCDFGGPLGNCTPNGDIWNVSDGESSGGLFTSTQVIDLPVGEATDFVQDLWLRLGATQGTTTFDASNTAWLNITSLDPGVTFSTGSGFTYSEDPEVPEPSALLPLSAALLGLVLRKAGGRRR